MSEAIRLEGVKDLEAALRKFDVSTSRKMTRAIGKAQNIIINDARLNIPPISDWGLTSWWLRPSKGGNMNGMPKAPRPFPAYNNIEMKAGLKKKRQKNAPNKAGWRTTYFVEQMSPAGNIYEKAGVVAGASRRSNYSRNPNASLAFKNKMQNFEPVQKGQGRALIKAGRDNIGEVKSLISKARYEAELELQQAFNREAAI